ncbi:vWA domain-containing protein [Paraliomyxa miuraensis]|uniref:vWA domain-containing protein n=1 Tax=Paraliomyxa miuraensis TaxID=376150 RepID=UPI00224DF1CC|nr:vWA domain-containing protein [Paraliomyxa miuraensis]MCX4246779.1 VWA domain-containing protein [Paraliomyxa miuraensis]
MSGFVPSCWSLGASLLLLVACTAQPPADDEGADASTSTTASTVPPTTGPGDTTTTAPPPDGTGTTAADPTTSGTTTGDDPTMGPPIFDVNELPDAPMFDMGCRKVDFLFVIDNSGSMSAQQAQLLASFNGFITAIQASLDDTVDSYHVGVITSDNYSYNQPGCTTIGDLVTQTQNGGNCAPFAEGHRFATEQDDLLAKFPCMANVGASGSPIEQPVTATIASFDPSKTGVGDCNYGFLRDDAILVLVIVTDDPPYDFDVDDAHPTNAGNVASWHDQVIAAKNDDPEALVVIGFIPWMNLTCVFGGDSPNLIDFVDSFGEQGVMASICEPDFGPVFADTVETIVTTCENFDPPA